MFWIVPELTVKGSAGRSTFYDVCLYPCTWSCLIKKFSRFIHLWWVHLEDWWMWYSLAYLWQIWILLVLYRLQNAAFMVTWIKVLIHIGYLFKRRDKKLDSLWWQWLWINIYDTLCIFFSWLLCVFFSYCSCAKLNCVGSSDPFGICVFSCLQFSWIILLLKVLKNIIDRTCSTSIFFVGTGLFYGNSRRYITSY